MNTTTSGSSYSDLAPRGEAWAIMSYSDYVMTLIVLHYVVKPVLVSVGVPSNVINCLVFWRQGLRDRMNICLFTLSSVDLCLLIVSMVFSVGYYLQQGDPENFQGVYDFLVAFVSGANQAFRTASGCITMVIAVERCLCVVFPLKAASLISPRNMAAIMSFIVCFTQLALLTMPTSYVLLQVANSTSKFVIANSDWYLRHRVFYSVFENAFMMSALPLATFLVTCLATAVTVVKLRAAMAWRKTTAAGREEGQGQHTALTKMLVMVSCIYILSVTPWVVFYFARLMMEDFTSQGRYYYFYWASAITAVHCSYVNSAVGFYVYFNRSRRFKKDVFSLLGWASPAPKSICCSQHGLSHKRVCE